MLKGLGQLIRDGLMSVVGVLGKNERDNLIEGAVSLLESADTSLLLEGSGSAGPGARPVVVAGETARSRFWPGSGCLPPLPAERGPGRRLGFGAP